MKCNMCLYLNIDGKYYPFCSPLLCMQCDKEDTLKQSVTIADHRVKADA